MTRTHLRLLATAIASTAMLGVTTTPAGATRSIEASSALWAYQRGDQHESFVVDVSPDPQRIDYVRLDKASGRTPAHPGWDLRFSDESVGAGLPAQDVELRVRSDAAGSSGSATSFISIVDKSATGQPFLVIRTGGGLQCSEVTGSISRYTIGDTAFYHRNAQGGLVEFDPSAGPATVNDVTPGHHADEAPVGFTSVKVDQVDNVSQITQYRPFARYAYSTLAGATGLEIVITQSDQPNDPNPTTHRLLLNTTAVAC